jgi:hypothetical protein
MASLRTETSRSCNTYREAVGHSSCDYADKMAKAGCRTVEQWAQRIKQRLSSYSTPYLYCIPDASRVRIWAVGRRPFASTATVVEPSLSQPWKLEARAVRLVAGQSHLIYYCNKHSLIYW